MFSHIWVDLLLFCPNIPFWSRFSHVYLYYQIFSFIYLYLPTCTLIYPYLVTFTLNCPNFTIYAIFTLHRYSFSMFNKTAPLCKFCKAIRQLIMDSEILHLTLCDLNLTFKVPKNSKILRQAEILYLTSYYVFLINFMHNMLRIWKTAN